jgi:hypothetical protein
VLAFVFDDKNTLIVQQGHKIRIEEFPIGEW